MIIGLVSDRCWYWVYCISCLYCPILRASQHAWQPLVGGK